MKKTQLVVGAVLVAVGGVWIFQGYGTLTGSFMTGSPFWMWAGVACAVTGVVLLVRTLRRKGGRLDD